MRYETAVELLEQISYKPEYRLDWSASSSPWDTPGTITVRVEAIVPNSNNYPRYQGKSIAGDTFEIDLSVIPESDSASFIRIVLDSLIAWEIHEAREFFRFGPGMIAPFHPHKPAGRDLWDQTDTAKRAITRPVDHKYQLVGSDI